MACRIPYWIWRTFLHKSSVQCKCRHTSKEISKSRSDHQGIKISLFYWRIGRRMHTWLSTTPNNYLRAKMCLPVSLKELAELARPGFGNSTFFHASRLCGNPPNPLASKFVQVRHALRMRAWGNDNPSSGNVRNLNGRNGSGLIHRENLGCGQRRAFHIAYCLKQSKSWRLRYSVVDFFSKTFERQIWSGIP